MLTVHHVGIGGQDVILSPRLRQGVSISYYIACGRGTVMLLLSLAKGSGRWTKPIHIHTYITHTGTYHSQVRQYAGILCELSRIAFEIFVRSKLSGIDKDRRNHHVIVASCLTDQRQMTYLDQRKCE
jgi:hypothetical protein